MEPRPGTKYSTDYYKQSPGEYSRVDQHVRRVIQEVVEIAHKNNALEDLELPLKGYPRTNKQPNYSMLDIMKDMLDQLNHERDIPSGLLGRWNKLFEDFDDFQITMQPTNFPNPLFNKLFYQ
jgi:hypothetical protein